MKRQEVRLSAEELLETVRGEGWTVRGGHSITSPFQGSPVMSIKLDGDNVVIECRRRRHVLPTCHIVKVYSHVIDIRMHFMRRQQRKMIDGGGWHDIPVLETALRLANKKLGIEMAKARKAETTRRQTERKAELDRQGQQD